MGLFFSDVEEFETESKISEGEEKPCETVTEVLNEEVRGKSTNNNVTRVNVDEAKRDSGAKQKNETKPKKSKEDTNRKRKNEADDLENRILSKTVEKIQEIMAQGEYMRNTNAGIRDPKGKSIEVTSSPSGSTIYKEAVSPAVTLTMKAE